MSRTPMTPEQRARLEALLEHYTQQAAAFGPESPLWRTSVELVDFLAGRWQPTYCFTLEQWLEQADLELEPEMKFEAPMDSFRIKGRGEILITRLPKPMERDQLNRLIGKTVLLGDRPFRVSGVETYAMTHLRPPINIGLMGEYLAPAPTT